MSDTAPNKSEPDESTAFSLLPPDSSNEVPIWVFPSIRGRRNGWHVFIKDGLWYEGSDHDERKWVLHSEYVHLERRILDSLPRKLSDRVAAEMMDLIIDQVANDNRVNYLQGARATLSVCALVCRAWKRRSCLHLYSSMAVGREAYDALITALKPKDSPTRPLLRSVRELYIQESKSNPFLHTLPLALGRSMPMLTSLHVHVDSDSVLPFRSDPGYFALIPLIGANLLKLTLHEVTWLHFSDFRRYVDSLPRLVELRMVFNRLHRSASLDPFAIMPGRTRPTHRQLSLLHINGCIDSLSAAMLKLALQWLLATPEPPPIRTLQIDAREADEETSSLHSRLVKALCGTLEDWNIYNDRFISKSDSPGCSNLRNVHYYDTQLYLSMEAFWENIKHLLSRLCGERIRRIYVALGVWSLEDTHQFLSRKIGRENLNEQESINELMLSPRFNALEHFEFEIHVIFPSSINEDAESARQLYLSITGCVQRLFCVWYQRGIVTVMLDRKIYNAPVIKKARAKQKMQHVEVPQTTKPVLLLGYRPMSHVLQRTEKEDPSVSACNDIDDEL